MLLAIPFGLAIGLAVGALGGGGSVLAVPVLVYVFGQTVPEATTASLLVVSAGAIAGATAHASAGRVCWRHASAFTAAALPGIVLGTVAADAVGASVLLAGFALVMLFAARATWQRACEQQEDAGGRLPGAACPPLNLPRDVLAGAGVGFVTGFFGVGGGFLIVPVLAVALAFTIRTAVGTSLVIITATALLSLGAHLAAGRAVDVPLTLLLTAACVAGAAGGVRLASRAPARDLGRAFALLVTGVAVYLLISVAALGGPPGTG
jgi:uncharacterized membrane protein YfcA